MAEKITLEDQVKTLQRQFGGLVKLVKDLKTSVEALEKKTVPNKQDEVKEIMEAQRIVDEILVANSDAIKRINKEIEELTKNNQHFPRDTSENDTRFEKTSMNGRIDEVVKTGRKRCRYFNRGFCKFTTKCRFVHTKQVCKDHIKNMKCENKDCLDRHPKVCKWLSSVSGCTRTDCEYLHVTLATSDKQTTEYKCVSCKGVWKERACVIQHMINQKQVHFCLNCDDWVQKKEKVFDKGWTLLDQDGFLRTGI